MESTSANKILGHNYFVCPSCGSIETVSRKSLEYMGAIDIVCLACEGKLLTVRVNRELEIPTVFIEDTKTR